VLWKTAAKWAAPSRGEGPPGSWTARVRRTGRPTAPAEVVRKIVRLRPLRAKVVQASSTSRARGVDVALLLGNGTGHRAGAGARGQAPWCDGGRLEGTAPPGEHEQCAEEEADRAEQSPGDGDPRGHQLVGAREHVA